MLKISLMLYTFGITNKTCEIKNSLKQISEKN